MLCPQCKSDQHVVKNTRNKKDDTITRRRACLTCKHRWSTYECQVGQCHFEAEHDTMYPHWRDKHG